MKNSNIVILLAIALQISAIDLPLKPTESVCAALMSSYDPIKIDMNFPTLADRADGQNFKVVLNSLTTREVDYESYVAPGTTLRKSIQLPTNTIYQLCITFESARTFPENFTFYIGFTQTEDFQSLIGNVEIPEQLAKEQNLKQMYLTSTKLLKVSQIIATHQKKQRDLEDEIVTKSIHKTQRILTLSLVEFLVIILSGFYQMFALRKFLIEKNLY